MFKYTISSSNYELFLHDELYCVHPISVCWVLLQRSPTRLVLLPGRIIFYLLWLIKWFGLSQSGGRPGELIVFRNILLRPCRRIEEIINNDHKTFNFCTVFRRASGHQSHQSLSSWNLILICSILHFDSISMIANINFHFVLDNYDKISKLILEPEIWYCKHLILFLKFIWV